MAANGWQARLPSLEHTAFHTLVVLTACGMLFPAGENWPDIYHDTWRYTGWAPLYWVAYNVIVVFILANFYLASVLQHFENASALESGAITFSDLVRFKDIWKACDPGESGMIPFSGLRPFLMRYAKVGKWAKSGQGSRSVQKALKAVMSFYSPPSARQPDAAGAGGGWASVSARKGGTSNRSPPTSGRRSFNTPAASGSCRSPRVPSPELPPGEDDHDGSPEVAEDKKFVWDKRTDSAGRTPFMSYIAKGLYSRRWYGLVRAEIRALSVQTFIQQYIIAHRRDYKYFCLLQQPDAVFGIGATASAVPEREWNYLARLREDAIAAAHALPDHELPVPFGKLLVTLCKWKLGSGVLSPVERLNRELKLTTFYSQMMAVRIQAMLRGFMQRRAFNIRRWRVASRMLQRWWRRQQALTLVQRGHQSPGRLHTTAASNGHKPRGPVKTLHFSPLASFHAADPTPLQFSPHSLAAGTALLNLSSDMEARPRAGSYHDAGSGGAALQTSTVTQMTTPAAGARWERTARSSLESAQLKSVQSSGASASTLTPLPQRLSEGSAVSSTPPQRLSGSMAASSTPPLTYSASIHGRLVAARQATAARVSSPGLSPTGIPRQAQSTSESEDSDGEYEV